MLFMRTFLLDTHRHCPDLSEAWPALMAPKRKAWEVRLEGRQNNDEGDTISLAPTQFSLWGRGFQDVWSKLHVQCNDKQQV